MKFIKFIFFLLIMSLLTSALRAQDKGGQKDPLPFPPDSIYKYISASTERYVKPEEIPSRVSIEEWEEDLDYLENLIKKEIPYSAQLIHPEVLRKEINDLKSRLPELSRDQKILGLYDLLNFPSKGTGHFKIFGSQRNFGWQAMPFYTFKFYDATYIMSALNTSLIGRRILAINETPIDSVYKILSPYVTADNRWARETHVQERILKWANPLKALGIIEDLDNFSITILNKDGDKEEIQMTALEVDTESYVRFLTSSKCRPKTQRNLQWSPASTQENSDEPFYRVEYVDSLDMIYLQINILVSEDRVPMYSNQSTTELADSLSHLADSLPLKKFVIDLRTNEGGNTADGDPIIEMIRNHTKINKKGTLYTLISPITNSAAGLFSMKMEQQTNTTFAGQNGGFAPNIWGEISAKVLPNTKIVVYLSFAYYEGGFPNSDRYFITPEINVPFTADQHWNNNDKTLMAVLAHSPAPEQPIYPNMTHEQIEGFYKLSPTHRVEITSQERLHLRIDRGEKEVFLESDLYPITETFFNTSIADLTLKYEKKRSKLFLYMKGVAYPLEKMEGKFKLPLEYLLEGEFDKGKAAMKSALEEGVLFGNDFIEYPLTNLVYEGTLPNWPSGITEEERLKLALPYVTLSTELIPASWRTYANLAVIHKELGNQKEVRRLANIILKLDKAAVGFVRENLELDPDSLKN